MEQARAAVDDVEPPSFDDTIVARERASRTMQRAGVTFFGSDPSTAVIERSRYDMKLPATDARSRAVSQ